MENKEKTKKFISELRSLMNKYEVRIFAEGKKIYFENEDMDIKVDINEELNDEILEFW